MAMLDLAVIEDPTAALDQAGNPTQFVLAVCERAKTWLQLAKEHDDTVEALSKAKETKQFAATLRTATMQKELGKDCELAAQEICRRAERLVAELIRLGQEAAEIAREGQNSPTTFRTAEYPQDSAVPRPRALDYFGSPNERRDANAMADIPEEQFEAILDEAKAEGNLTRANVVRKTGRQASGDRGQTAPRPRRERTESPPRNEWHHKRHRIDSNRVVRQSILAADGAAAGLDLVNWDEVEPEDWWIESLSASIRILRGMLNDIKEIQ